MIEINRTRAAAAPMMVLAAVAVLLRFPPDGKSFYPLCPIYSAFHVQCPGCGGTRALAAFVCGDLGAAVQDNALITLLIPFAAGYGATVYWRWVRGKKLEWPRLHPGVLWGVSLAAVIFTVVRNLPSQ